MKYELPKLTYSYDALEPHIDAKTMEIHHTKHHQAYIDKLNAALEKYPDLQQRALEDLLGDLEAIPEDIRAAVRNQGGGHANHSLFWMVMAAPSNGAGGEPSGDLAEAINAAFGNFLDFRKKFSETAAGIFGSGWAWLAADPSTSSGQGGKLHLHGLPNQDSPLMHGHVPILGLDVWEHAYYLKYQNKRPDYIENWWHLVNWDEVTRRYREAI